MTSLVSRRAVMQWLAAAAAHTVTAHAGASPVAAEQKTASPQLEELLARKRSAHFGIKADGSSLIAGSLYTASTEHPRDLSFDVSNNQISATITTEGIVRRACVSQGVVPLPLAAVQGGVYCAKRLLYGGPSFVQSEIDGVVPQSGVAIGLVENVLPLFTQSYPETKIHRLYFAPVDLSRLDRSPRAILQIIVLENPGPHPCTAALKVSENDAASLLCESDVRGAQESSCIQANSRWIVLDPATQQAARSWSLTVPAGAVAALTFAWILGETEEEIDETVGRLRSRSVDAWLEDTFETRKAAYGELSIPDDTLAAEQVTRFAELSRQSALRQKDGRFNGGFLGSDVDMRPFNWNKDNYYSMLTMSLFEPQLCADSISYFLEWGHPSQATGRGLQRFPGAGPITQSLSNSLSGLALASAYYRASGDKAFFLKQPQMLKKARNLLDAVLASRRDEPMLFPSMYFSDGDARGDYHTGSNVVAWFAFAGMARISSEVYRDESQAARWHEIAEQVRASLDRHCAGKGPSGDRFFEGANSDGSFVQGHDGEESDTTLMPFYRFCRADDSRLLNHAELALSTANPLYSPDLDAIWWYNSAWRPATFPGWITGLAGARNEQQLRTRMDRIRKLTDLDGSIWWWPYPYGSKDRLSPVRGEGARKSGWAAAVYLCRFVHDVLGIRVDVPALTIEFAPFMPWDSFAWRNAKMGNAIFDLEWKRTAHAISATLINRNPEPYQASVTLITGRPELKALKVTGTNSPQPEPQPVILWNRHAIRLNFRLQPNRTTAITISI